MSAAFNRFVLRRLYNQNNIGKGTAGVKTRMDLHTTITGPTYIALGREVPLQKGGYAAPVVELGIRVLLYLSGSLSLETLGEELTLAMEPGSGTVVERLVKLARFVDNYTAPER